MNVIFNILIFVIGTLFGSFYTLALFRIPKREDITHTQSYCPKCNHKLSFLDLIPILSYIFIGGKCRYCKEKISSRYLIIEILSGILFLAIAILTNLTINTLSLITILNYSFFILYLTFVILISGIDRENRKMDKVVVIYGVVISIIYMVYLCIIGQTSIYRYGIYLVFFVIVLFIDTIYLKKHAENNYLNSLLLMIIIMNIFTNECVIICGVIITLLAIAIFILLGKKRTNKPERNIFHNIPIGYYLGVSNIVSVILALFINSIGSTL